MMKSLNMTRLVKFDFYKISINPKNSKDYDKNVKNTKKFLKIHILRHQSSNTSNYEQFVLQSSFTIFQKKNFAKTRENIKHLNLDNKNVLIRICELKFD